MVRGRMVGRVYEACLFACVTWSDPAIRAKFPARSVAASTTEYDPGRRIAGTENRSTPYGKLALVANTWWAPWLTTTPTWEYFDSRKLRVTGRLAAAFPVSWVSTGGVFSYVWKCWAVVQ